MYFRSKLFCCINTSVANVAVAAWQIKGDIVAATQKWCFDTCACEKGDINLNGKIDSGDAREILRYSADLINWSSVNAIFTKDWRLHSDRLQMPAAVNTTGSAKAWTRNSLRLKKSPSAMKMHRPVLPSVSIFSSHR